MTTEVLAAGQEIIDREIESVGSMTVLIATEHMLWQIDARRPDLIVFDEMRRYGTGVVGLDLSVHDLHYDISPEPGSLRQRRSPPGWSELQSKRARKAKR